MKEDKGVEFRAKKTFREILTQMRKREWKDTGDGVETGVCDYVFIVKEDGGFR